MNVRRPAFILGIPIVVGLLALAWWLRPHESSVAPPVAPVALPEQSAPSTPVESASSEPPALERPAASFATFRGRVVDAVTREPVREFELTFVGTQRTKVGDEAPGTRQFSTTDGRFEWDYLPPGDWRVLADASGYQRFVFERLTLVKGTATPEAVLPLRRGQTLLGRIYDAATNTGIAAARISFRSASTGRYDGDWRTRPSATSAKDGSFVLNGVPAGRTTLEVSASDYAGRELDVVVNDDTAPVEIGLSTGALIAGRLTDVDRVTPIAGTVGLHKLDPAAAGGTRRTGPAGEFAFPNLEPGSYRLTGRAPNGTATRDFVVTGNERFEGIALALSAGRVIRGRITGLRPDDLERVTLSLQRDGEFDHPDDAGRANERGEYELRGVKPGRVRVVADVTMRKQLSKVVDVPADSDVVANFDFPAGARLSGRVTHAGQPLPQLHLAPRPTKQDDDFFIYDVATSATGEYVVEGMPPGEYYIRIGYYRTRAFQVTGDTVFDIDIPPIQLAGRVLEDSGKAPVVEAALDVWSMQAGPLPRVRGRSNDFGQFGLVGLESGEFMLTAYKPGYEMFRRRITYSTPVRDMTIRLRRDAGVELRVHDAQSGEALQWLYAYEVIGDRNGTQLSIRLDEEGVGYLPRALAGTTLEFSTDGYAPQTLSWTGDRLDLRLIRQRR
ncbi:MAG TPA: carboxypeptidase regulatory-like domain-containing protein [Steroidobacteraceae bacterium]|nr:carboxypeptidase regulatory-like domain-containing protein [Steroidobacteraceae bacterium]